MPGSLLWAVGSLPPALPGGHLLGRGGNIPLRGLFQLADTAVEVDETLGHDVRQVLLVEVVLTIFKQ